MRRPSIGGMGRGRFGRRRLATAAAAALLPAWPALAMAQADELPELEPPEPTSAGAQVPATPQPLPSVLRAMELEYLTDAERAERRVFHGLWSEGDLEDPALRARAALASGVYDDPAFADPAVAPETRAAAMVRRGELSSALELLEGAGADSPRAGRLRAQALAGLGRTDEAARLVEDLVRAARDQPAGGARALTELVRALMLRAEIVGDPASEYRAMVGLLADASQRRDRLYWPALVAEAELLLSKSNAREGVQAATEALRRNPLAADAWAILGRFAVRAFNFDGVEQAAEQLDRIAARLGSRPEHDGLTVSPLADVIRARARLRQKDPHGAAVLLDRVLERYPKMREALALRCAAESMLYLDGDVASCLSRFEALSPGSALAHHEVGSALSEARQYDLAAPYLEEAIERQPNWPEPIVELGLMEMQAGNDARAIRFLERAVALDPFHKSAENQLTLARELESYAVIETPNFIIRHAPGPDAVLARDMADELERMHEVVVGHVSADLGRKTIIELMPDHAWFAVRITGQTSIYTIAACTGPVIAMEAPKIGKRHTTLYDWLRVARHEYAHTVTLARTRNRIPHWFTEAAAVYLELAPRDFDRCRLLAGAWDSGGLFDLEKINVMFVRPEKPTDRALAYAQAHWMYEFLLERWGAGAPGELMDAYARGESQVGAVERITGLPAGEFLEQFQEWGRADVEAWGLLAEPTIEELRFEETMGDPVLRDAAADGLASFARAAADALHRGGTAGPWPVELVGVTPELVDFWYALHPNHPDVLRLRIEQEKKWNGGEITEAMIPLLEAYAEARPVDDLPRRHLARLLLRSGDPAAAIEHLEWLDVREVYSPAYAVELAKRYAELGEWDKALKKARRATRIAPFDAGHRELLATVAIQAGDLDLAERQLVALIDIEPDRDVHRKRLEALERLRARGG